MKGVLEPRVRRLEASSGLPANVNPARADEDLDHVGTQHVRCGAGCSQGELQAAAGRGRSQSAALGPAVGEGRRKEAEAIGRLLVEDR